MIYYSDTEPFAKKNLALIMEVLTVFESKCGVLEGKTYDDGTLNYNWLAWFAWENTMSEVIGFLES